jgi:copper(I)-binding protein
MIKRALIALAPLSVLTLAACSPAEEAQTSAEPAEYAVIEGWVRNPLGGRDVTAGFVTLTAGAPGGQLVGASTDEADAVELHTMAMDGAVMRMRHVDAIDIPAGGAASLAPGGDHLMIFGVKPEELEDGEMALTLEFADGETLDVTLPVRDAAPELDPEMGAMSHDGHGMGDNGDAGSSDGDHGGHDGGHH